MQRTKAETVSTFFESFIISFPNWQSLATAHAEDIENYIRSIGLQTQRTKRLKSLAEEMVRRKGVLPKNRMELESLPFLGQYIANSIELLIFKQNKPLLDVNMARLLERYFRHRIRADIRYDPLLLDLSHELVNHTKAKFINWAVLDFAALVCKAGKPLCNQCILKLNCTYFNSHNNS
ncbi:MAG: hypothetical protein H3C54_07820 [Taibaiella sp.]|nr:hypothetical protein [Taibaiella sp.]